MPGCPVLRSMPCFAVKFAIDIFAALLWPVFGVSFDSSRISLRSALPVRLDSPIFTVMCIISQVAFDILVPRQTM